MAFKPKTFLDLCMAMKTGAVVNLDSGRSDATGTITAIQKEDGSGFCWNVRIQPEVKKMTDALMEPTTVFFRE